MDVDSIFKAAQFKRKQPASENSSSRPSKSAKLSPSSSIKSNHAVTIEDVPEEDRHEVLDIQRDEVYDEEHGYDVDNGEDFGDFGGEDERFEGDGLTEEQRQILELLDQAEENEGFNLDLPALKKLILKFERAITKNQEHRMKFADEPEKFVESEADLDAAIKELQTLATSPSLYASAVNLGVIPSIMSLLSHENTDIVIDTIELLNELTDEDVINPEELDDEVEEGIKLFMNSLLENQLLDLLVQNLSRLDENQPEDKQGVFNTLNVIENLTSFLPSVTETIVKKTSFLAWLLARIKVKPFDSNKQYASEILAILLQNSKENRLKLGKQGGVDVLLQVLASYKRKDPSTPDEVEFMENLFDALCSSLAEPEVKEKFREGEGFELMLIMLKERQLSRIRAVRVINYALSGSANDKVVIENCNYFVEILGLKTLFSAFMKKDLKKLQKKYRDFSDSADDEHLVSIIYSLLKTLSPDTHAISRNRVLNKFIESNFEKCERLVCLHVEYNRKMRRLQQEVELEESADPTLTPAELAEEIYLRKLDSGLFTLQLVDLITIMLLTEKNEIAESLHCIFKILWKKGGVEADEVRGVIKEYVNNLGNDNEKQQVLEMLDKFPN